LPTPHSLKKVKNIIESDPDRRYVVVSAPGKRFSNDAKITDLLYLLDAHRQYHVDASNVFNLIKERFVEIKNELNLKQPIEKELDAFYTSLSKMSQSEIVSRGEYFCAKLMAEYLGYAFVDAKDVIRLHHDKSIDWDATRSRLRAKANEYERFVFPGFLGQAANEACRSSQEAAATLPEQFWPTAWKQTYMKTGPTYPAF